MPCSSNDTRCPPLHCNASDTFRCFDFDESNELSVDEMTLSLKSTLTGLAKLSGEVPPDDLDLEDLSQQVSCSGPVAFWGCNGCLLCRVS